MKKIVSLGEILLRLSPPDNKRFIQAEEFLLNYGGSELNTLIAINNLGHNTSFITKIPDNLIGDSAVAAIKKYGIDTQFILRGGERIGLYYLEKGYSIRGSKVVYDRKNSAFSLSKAEEYEVEILDRVGAGDALSAGFLHGILSGENAATSIEYAAISCAFKHSIQGDFSILNEKELKAFIDEKNVGVIER